MRDLTKWRSESYQHLFMELTMSPRYWTDFPKSAACIDHDEDEERTRLLGTLGRRVAQLAEEVCTKKQWEVLDIVIFQGLSQSDCAKQLGRCQGAISRSLNGAIIKRRKYGGAYRKIRKAITADPESLRILGELGALSWLTGIERNRRRSP